MPMSKEPAVAFRQIEGMLINALSEVDKLGLQLTGIRLQQALEALEQEWFDEAA